MQHDYFSSFDQSNLCFLVMSVGVVVVIASLPEKKRRFSFKNDLKQRLLRFLEHEDFYVDLNTLI